MARTIEPRDPQRRLASTWTDGFGVTAIRCLQVIIIVALVAAVIWAGLQIRIVVISVIIALILSAAFAPLVRLLERIRVPHALAALLTLLLAILALAGVLVLVGFAVAGQADELTRAVRRGIRQVQTVASDAGLPIDGEQVQGFIDSAGKYLTSSSFGSTALSGLSAFGNFATALALVVVIVFFFLRDGRTIWEFLIRPFTGESHERAERIGTNSVAVLGAYVRGTALVALVDAVFIGAGLLILQVPLALPLTVIVFITAFIPVVGATLAGVLAALVALVFNGWVVALIVVAIVVVVNQLEGNVLQPFIMGKSLSLHPLVILLALTAGTILGGIIGAILSVPIASVIWTIMKSWPATPITGSPPEARGDPQV